MRLPNLSALTGGHGPESGPAARALYNSTDELESIVEKLSVRDPQMAASEHTFLFYARTRLSKIPSTTPNGDDEASLFVELTLTGDAIANTELRESWLESVQPRTSSIRNAHAP